MCLYKYTHTDLSTFIYELMHSHITIPSHIAIPSCSVHICSKGVCIDLVPHKGAQANMYAAMWKGLSKYEGTLSKQEARGGPTIQMLAPRGSKDL